MKYIGPKFSILERDGVELDFQEEYIPIAKDILLNRIGTRTIDSVIGKPHFKRKFEDEDLVIDAGEILVLHEPEFVANLILDGDLVLI